MRDFAITSAKQGVTRFRNKGGASKDSFYTLKNCYVTSDRSVVPRPGSRLDTTLPAGTKGLMMFRGKLYVFSAEPVTITNPKYANLVLQHPDAGSTAGIEKIHFAQPFLGYPYVVAEFEGEPGTYYHYWLQELGSWQPNTIYRIGEFVLPMTQNGYSYAANRVGEPNPAWGPGIPVAVGDILEPTTYNGFQYEIMSIEGSVTVTGNVEPTWVAAEDATVIEDIEGGGGVPSAPSNPTPTVPPDVRDRYGNQGGYRQTGGNSQAQEEL